MKKKNFWQVILNTIYYFRKLIENWSECKFQVESLCFFNPPGSGQIGGQHFYAWCPSVRLTKTL